MREAAGATIEFEKVLDLTYKNIWALLASNAYKYINIDMSDLRQHFESVCRCCPAMSQWIFLWMSMRLAPLSFWSLGPSGSMKQNRPSTACRGMICDQLVPVMVWLWFHFQWITAHVNTAKQFFEHPLESCNGNLQELDGSVLYSSATMEVIAHVVQCLLTVEHCRIHFKCDIVF